jgi:hypothetical protein
MEKLMINIDELEKDAQQQLENQAARFSLKDLTTCGERLESYKAVHAELLQKLEELQDKITHLETVVLPDALRNLGLKDYTLMSGAKVSLVDVVAASITDKNKKGAHDWLRAHGHGDIIKNHVVVSFGKGEDSYANNLLQELVDKRDADLIKFGDIEQKEAVHASTLKAFVKSQLAQGTEFPPTLFNLYTGQTVKMTK